MLSGLGGHPAKIVGYEPVTADGDPAQTLYRLADVMPIDIKAIKRYHFEQGSFMGLVKFTVFRSGYTGEDGVEVILSAKAAPMAMKMLGGKMDKPDVFFCPSDAKVINSDPAK